MLQYCFATGRLWHCFSWEKRANQRDRHCTYRICSHMGCFMNPGNHPLLRKLCPRFWSVHWSICKGQDSEEWACGRLLAFSSFRGLTQQGKRITAPCFCGMCLWYISLRHCAAGLAHSIARVWIPTCIAILGLSFTAEVFQQKKENKKKGKEEYNKSMTGILSKSNRCNSFG